MEKHKVFKMLKRSQNLKYRLIVNSLIVGILVGLTIVAHRIIISKLSPIFLNIYKKGRYNLIIIPLIFFILIFSILSVSFLKIFFGYVNIIIYNFF